MLKQLKCWRKGHRFLMRYNIQKHCYSPSGFDRCECCNKLRGFHEPRQITRV